MTKPDVLKKRFIKNRRILYIALTLTITGGILAEEASSRQSPLTPAAQVETMGSSLSFWMEARLECGAESTFEGSETVIESRRGAYREALEKSRALGLDGSDRSSRVYRDAVVAPGLRALNRSFSCRRADQEVRSIMARAVAAEFTGTPLAPRDGFESNPVTVEGRSFRSFAEFTSAALPLLGLRSASGGELQRALVAHMVAAYVRKHAVEQDGRPGFLTVSQRETLKTMVSQVNRGFSGLEREIADRGLAPASVRTPFNRRPGTSALDKDRSDTKPAPAPG